MAKFEEAIYILHCFQKKTAVTSKRDKDIVDARYRAVVHDEAAEIFRITRPRVSDMVNKKTAQVTVDALVGMLARIGKPVKLVIG